MLTCSALHIMFLQPSPDVFTLVCSVRLGDLVYAGMCPYVSPKVGARNEPGTFQK